MAGSDARAQAVGSDLQEGQAGRYAWLLVLGVAVGFFEAAVVVYLRELLYPAGFRFPIVMASPRVEIVELARELASLVLLAAGAHLAGRFFLERFAAFAILFGTWDLLYYVFLRIVLGWPESLATWDILFLLPTTWVGPVLAPVINAMSMVIFGALIWYHKSKERLIALKRREWILLILGSLTVVWAYIEDYVNFLHQEFSWNEIFFPSDAGRLMDLASTYIPLGFNWWIFGTGQLIIILAIGLWCFSHRGSQRVSQST